MSPAKISEKRKNRAEFEIDKVFAGVRIHKRAPSKKLYQPYLNMLQHLADTGNVAILKAINRKDSPQTLESIYADYKAGRLDDIVTVEAVSPLGESLRAYLKARSRPDTSAAGTNPAPIQLGKKDDGSELAPLSKATISSYGDQVNVMLTDPTTTPPTSYEEFPVERMADVLNAYRARAIRSGHVTSFRVARAVCLSFASHMKGHGKHSPLWRQIAAIKNIPAPAGKKVSKYKGHAREVVDVVRVVQVMKDLVEKQAKAPKSGAVQLRFQDVPHHKYFWWACVAGFRTAEFFSYPFDLLPDGVAIHGKKNKWSDRESLLIEPISKPLFKTPDSTNDYIRKATKRLLEKAQAVLADPNATPDAKATAAEDVTTFSSHWHFYDGRHSFMHWLEEAGVSDTRAMKYSGHKPANVHKTYQWHDTGPYRSDDAQLLRDYIKRCVTQGKKPKPAPKPVVDDFLASLDSLVTPD